MQCRALPNNVAAIEAIEAIEAFRGARHATPAPGTAGVRAWTVGGWVGV